MNAVLLAVIIMVGLSLARVHVVLSLIVGAVVGGLLAGLPLVDVENGATGVLTHFQDGIKGGSRHCVILCHAWGICDGDCSLWRAKGTC